MFYGVKLTSKDIKNLAKQLEYMGVCETMSIDDWLVYRDKKAEGYTRVAYSQGRYGTTWELFYIKNTKKFILI